MLSPLLNSSFLGWRVGLHRQAHRADSTPCIKPPPPIYISQELNTEGSPVITHSGETNGYHIEVPEGMFRDDCHVCASYI